MVSARGYIKRSMAVELLAQVCMYTRHANAEGVLEYPVQKRQENAYGRGFSGHGYHDCRTV